MSLHIHKQTCPACFAHSDNNVCTLRPAELTFQSRSKIFPSCIFLVHVCQASLNFFLCFWSSFVLTGHRTDSFYITNLVVFKKEKQNQK